MEVRKCSLDAYNQGLFSSSFLLQTACHTAFTTAQVQYVNVNGSKYTFHRRGHVEGVEKRVAAGSAASTLPSLQSQR